MTYILHKLSEGFIITSDEFPYPNDIVLSTVTNTLVTFTDPRFFSENTYFKVIAQQDQIDFSLVENIINSLNYPIKIEGYFEHNLFKITKIWENY